MEVGNNVARVEGYDLATGEKQIYPHQDCKFGYRSSIFKTTLRNQFLITAVVFSLVKFDDNYTFITHYPDVQERLKGKKVESLTEISDIIADIRANKLPDIKKV
ncbi:MAG: hypothetical protein LBG59_04430 [Candidatus Peribacteria bacterium]|jgi:UDP-N-acetylmuramate dehydrogenase|nr:hypothetical protein [Candidatus Peribacteria bacterium]